jgi:hypothetical protein
VASSTCFDEQFSNIRQKQWQKFAEHAGCTHVEMTLDMCVTLHANSHMTLELIGSVQHANGIYMDTALNTPRNMEFVSGQKHKLAFLADGLQEIQEFLQSIRHQRLPWTQQTQKKVLQIHRWETGCS